MSQAAQPGQDRRRRREAAAGVENSPGRREPRAQPEARHVTDPSIPPVIIFGSGDTGVLIELQDCTLCLKEGRPCLLPVEAYVFVSPARDQHVPLAIPLPETTQAQPT